MYEQIIPFPASTDFQAAFVEKREAPTERTLDGNVRPSETLVDFRHLVAFWHPADLDRPGPELIEDGAEALG